MKLGYIIKKYREDNSVSMRLFEQRSGLSRSYISLLERNMVDSPTYKTIGKVAAGMGIPIDQLLSMLDAEQEVSLSIQDETIFQNQDFTVSSPTRVMKPNAEDFLSSSLYSMTEERETLEERPFREEPSREEIIIWLREHFRRAAYSGGDYENWPTEKLRKMYEELREQERKDEEGENELS